MKPLTNPEKYQHVRDLDDYISRISANIPLLKNGSLKLVHACYIVPIDGHWLYFDYPHNAVADAFNRDLNDPNNPISTASNKAIKLFRRFEAKTQKHPFVCYKYGLDNEHRQFFLAKMWSNMHPLNNSQRRVLKKYLPVIYQAAHLEHLHTHLADVRSASATELNNIRVEELITFFWPIQLKNEPVSGTSIACSFTIAPGFKIDKEFELDELLYYIKTYFDSPVLTKLINDKRVSEILVYQHSFQNLDLLGAVTTIDNLAKDPGNPYYQIEWKKARNKINAWRLFSNFLFKIEQIESGVPVPDRNRHIKVGVFETLRYFDRELNYFGIATEFKQIGDCSMDTYVPSGRALYDRAIVLWNIIENSWKAARENKAVEINIIAGFDNSKLYINFRNKGLMPAALLNYCRNEAPYPIIDETSDNPLRGLQIIKAKCEMYEWKFQVNSDEQKDETETLIFF